MFVLFFSFLNKYKLFSFCFHNGIHWKRVYVIFANINQSTYIRSRNQTRFAVVDICMNRHRLCLVLESLTSTKNFPRNLLITTIVQDKPYSLTNFYSENVFSYTNKSTGISELSTIENSEALWETLLPIFTFTAVMYPEIWDTIAIKAVFPLPLSDKVCCKIWIWFLIFSILLLLASSSEPYF